MIKDRKHLKFISTLPCLICNVHGKTQAAHVRSGNGAGMGIKSGDDCTVPLCIKHHTLQHETSEDLFWLNHGGTRNITALANDLYAVSGDTIKALKLIVRYDAVPID